MYLTKYKGDLLKMQKKILWSLLFGSYSSFLLSWILSCVIYNITYGFKLTDLTIEIGVGFIIGVMLMIYLIEIGETIVDYKDPKQIRLENEIRKLKAKEYYLKNKKEYDTEIQSLKRRVLCLKNELKLGAPPLMCVHCNTKIPQKACFCPNCGCEV